MLIQSLPIRLNDLVLSGQLWSYLADLNEQARERLSLIVEQMKASEGVTEEQKAADQMAWGAMNSVRNRAEEIILREMIYGEDTVSESSKNFGVVILSRQSTIPLPARSTRN